MNLTDDQKLRKIRRGERAVTDLERLGLHYLLGGARGAGGVILPPSGPRTGWTDCSGCQYYLLDVMGIPYDRSKPLWTGSLKDWGVEGYSEFFTLFLKEPDRVDGHVIARLRHRPGWRHRSGPARFRWVECGGFDNPKAGGGPTWFRPTKARVAEFPIRRHFPGF